MPFPSVSLLERLFGIFFRPLRPWGSIPLACSFCGHTQHEVKKLVAGPTVFICDGCTRTASGAFEAGGAKPGQCSFCGKDGAVFSPSAGKTASAICDDCVGLSRDIIAEEIDREPTAGPRRPPPGGTR